MKFGKEDLKTLVKEMLAERLSKLKVINEDERQEEPLGYEEDPTIEMEEYSKYELESLESLRQTNKLLGELLTQMKTITYFSTPGRSPAESSLEKTMAGAIQEKKQKNKK